MRRILLAFPVLLLGCQQPEVSTDASLPSGRPVDLTHPFSAETIFWPTAAGFELTVDFKGMTEGGYYYEANTFSTAEHGGTHLDAPIHFADSTNSNDEIPIEQLMGPAVVVDVTAKASADPDYLISIDDLLAFEAAHGEIPAGSIVLFRTGYGSFWPDANRYLGTDERGPDAVAKLHFPGIDPVAAQWIVDNRPIRAVGLDTASIDRGQSTDYLTHRILFAENIPAFENVAHLDELPPTGSYVVALPMKITGGSGGPLRIIALVP